MQVSIWANGPDVPGLVCFDARLTDRSRSRGLFGDRPTTARDQLYGQAGWDYGFNFGNISVLAGQLMGLGPLEAMPGRGRIGVPGVVQRLAIHAHGLPGQVFVNGVDSVKLSVKTIPRMITDLNNIGSMMPDDPTNPAVILFMGCVAGSGRWGSELLVALSKIWRNLKVVGFATLGYVAAGEMKRGTEMCNEPGMRDTTALIKGEADSLAGRYWKDLETWPWASERSPRAKVAFNERIIKGQQW